MIVGCRNKHITITVSDNGQGIPKDLIPALTERGKTFGKQSGSGLGLYHAGQTVMAWEGSLKIESEPGKGTDVTVMLPRRNPPEWFLPEIDLRNKKKVIVLDDDDSIHQVWQNRFCKEKIENIQQYDFKTSQHFAAWFRENGNAEKESCLFLCDYELLGSKKTGLEVIIELGIEKKSVLVTSRFEDPPVLQQCMEMGIKLVPKNLAVTAQQIPRHLF